MPHCLRLVRVEMREEGRVSVKPGPGLTLAMMFREGMVYARTLISLSAIGVLRDAKAFDDAYFGLQ